MEKIRHNEEYLPFFLGSTPKEAEENYLRFQPFLKKISSTYAKASGLDEGDMFGESLNGLAKALKDYDPERSNQFFSYCCFRIRNELNRYCKKNNSILNVPIYIKDTNIHIEKIKTILLRSNLSDEEIERTIYSGSVAETLPKNACLEIENHIEKIKNIARNSNITYKALVKRAEFIPSNSLYDEGMNQDASYSRDMEILDAKLAVISLREFMDEEDMIITNHILNGKTYEDIGKEFGKTSAWVKTKLNKIKERVLNSS